MHSLFSVFIFLLQLSSPASLSFDAIVFPPPHFLLGLFVFTLPQAYIHPTHTSYHPLEVHMKRHTVALQPASACYFGVQALG